MSAYVYGIPPSPDVIVCGPNYEIPDGYTPVKTVTASGGVMTYTAALVCVPKSLLKKSAVGTPLFTKHNISIRSFQIEQNTGNVTTFNTTIKDSNYRVVDVALISIAPNPNDLSRYLLNFIAVFM